MCQSVIFGSLTLNNARNMILGCVPVGHIWKFDLEEYGYMPVFRQPRIQTGQYLDKYCFNQSESRQRRNY